jgi:hypothetical protein
VDEPKELIVPHNAGSDGLGRPSYIDSYAVRERDENGGVTSASDGDLEARHFFVQNWHADMITMIDDADAIFRNQLRYSAYGEHEELIVGDVDDGNGGGVRDGGITLDDELEYLARYESGDAVCDMDDGSGHGAPDTGVTIDDLLYFLGAYEAGGYGVDARVMYAG